MIDAKAYLQQIKLYDTHINNKLEEKARLKMMALNITSTIKGDVSSGSHSQDKIGDAMAKVVDLEREIDEAIDKYVELKKSVSAIVDRLQDADQLNVIHKRYFEYKTWETIACEIGYEYRTVTRIHGRALQSINEIMKSCPKMS